MNDKIAIIVDPFSSGVLYSGLFAKQGIKSIAVLSNLPDREVQRVDLIEQDFVEILKEEDFTFSSLVEYLKSLPIITILPGEEIGVPLADKLIHEIMPQFENVYTLSKARCNKWEMYKAISYNNIPNIKQFATADINEALLWLEKIDFKNTDLVVKPDQSFSTQGVTKVTNIKDFPAVFNKIKIGKNIVGFKGNKVLIQEYTEGEEYIIDGFSYESIHSVSNICKYKKTDNGKFMAVYDNMIWIHHEDPVVTELTTYAHKVLDAIGVKFGLSHMEVILSKDGPKLVEVGVRSHGGGHAKFSRIATGDSQIDRAVNYFSSNCKNTPDNFYNLQTNFMIVFLIARRVATIKNLSVLEEIKKLDSFFSSHVNLKQGETVYPTKDLINSLKLGFISLCHKNSKQIEEDYEKIRLFEKQLFV